MPWNQKTNVISLKRNDSIKILYMVHKLCHTEAVNKKADYFMTQWPKRGEESREFMKMS